MCRNNTNESISKGLQKFADISREFNKRYHSFLEQQSHFNEMIAPVSTAMEQLNRSNLNLEETMNSMEIYSVAQHQVNISKVDFSQLTQVAGTANRLVQPYGNLLSSVSEISQAVSNMTDLRNNILNSIETGSIAAAAAQHQLNASQIDFKNLTCAIEEANSLKESIGNLLPSANIISQAASNMANPDTNNILNSIKLGSLAAASAQYQPDISRIDFNGLTRAIIEVNSLKEPFNLLSSIYNNVAANSPLFYGWYNTLDSTIIENIKRQVSLIPDLSGIDRITVYQKCKLMLYKFKWFPGVILAVSGKYFFKLVKFLSAVNEEDDHLEEDIDNKIESFFAESDIEQIKNGWNDTGLENVMIRILGEAINAYLRGEYALTINALAPMWEGLIHKKLNITTRQKPKLINEQFGELISDNNHEEIFFDYYKDFIVSQCDGVNDIVDGIPNRHGIAHGWYKNYPTKKAALNAILLTDFIIGLEPKK